MFTVDTHVLLGIFLKVQNILSMLRVTASYLLKNVYLLDSCVLDQCIYSPKTAHSYGKSAKLFARNFLCCIF